MNPNTDEEQVIQAEQRLAAAHLTLDIPLIAGLLHEDYLILQPGGSVETRQEVLSSYQSGERHWDKAEIELTEVTIYGRAARVLGIWRAKGTHARKPFDYQARYISIWIKERDKWRNLSYSSSEIEPNRLST